MTKEELNKKQLEFTADAFFSAAWRDMVSRTKTYNANADENEKAAGKTDIKNYVVVTLLKKYKDNIIDHKQHIENIEILRNKIENRLKPVLRNGEFSFGHTQKLLNMLLKYYWCAGWMKDWKTTTPPDMPIDNIILGELEYKGKSWPSFTRKDYEDLFNNNPKIQEIKNLSEWELDVWQKKAKREIKF